MCTTSCLEFGRAVITQEDVKGKSVIEVGSYDLNGSLRPLVQALGPKRYLGVDIARGPGVDIVCGADELVNHFGSEAFDLVLCTELLEHLKDWRVGVSNLKRVLKPKGVLIITTVSRGYPYHAAPQDYWRYELDDLRSIFSDFLIEALEDHPPDYHVFLRARKPDVFMEADLSAVNLYSIIRHTTTAAHGPRDLPRMSALKVRYRVRTILMMKLPRRLQRFITDRLLGGLRGHT